MGDETQEKEAVKESPKEPEAVKTVDAPALAPPPDALASVMSEIAGLKKRLEASEGAHASLVTRLATMVERVQKNAPPGFRGFLGLFRF